MFTEDHSENSSIQSDNVSDTTDAKAPPIQLNEVSKSVTAYSLNPSTFTQKLYVMLQDENLKDVIYWNDETKDSFFIIPNEKFIQILSIFFKHCNTSSFVRQLNMYSFHKISGDTNNIWEFKHAESLFQKDDIESLYKVKRRSTVSKPGSISSKKPQPHKVSSFDSMPLKRKSFDVSEEKKPKPKHRVSSLPNVIPFNQNENFNPELSHRHTNYNSYDKHQQIELSDADSIEKQNTLINSAMGNGQTLRLDQRSHKGSQKGKPQDLHQCMLDELNAMNSSLQSICDLVEYSHDQMKNNPEGLSTNENAMYRQVFGKLFQDLNKKQFLLKQHFDLQYGPSNMPVFPQPLPNQYPSFTPATPYGSFSLNTTPVMKRKGNVPEQLPVHHIPYQPQMVQQVINVPMNLKTPVSSSQAMYPMHIENIKDMNKQQMMMPVYTPQNPTMNSVSSAGLANNKNSIPQMGYPDQVMGFGGQPQFRDVKYGNVIQPKLNNVRYLNQQRPSSTTGYGAPIESKMKNIMLQNFDARNSSLPNLKDVVSIKPPAGQDNNTLIGKGVEMAKNISGGSPKSS